ncbi:hypothetical protein D3C81_2085610 [compost metagenome]
MQQHDAAPVGLAVGGDVHVSHLQGLALGLEVEVLDGVGVFETLQLWTVFRAFGISDDRQCGGQQQAGQPARASLGHG